eukprot:9816012-Prorocentrum_lima.AAC.1
MDNVEKELEKEKEASARETRAAQERQGEQQGAIEMLQAEVERLRGRLRTERHAFEADQAS